MPKRSVVLAPGEYYHIFNRGVAKNPIFASPKDYRRLFATFQYYRWETTPLRLSFFLHAPIEERIRILEKLRTEKKPTITPICYTFMPNHFHLLVRQESKQGVQNFMQHSMNSYSKFFNTKYHRVGGLFQGSFKAVRIESDDQLIHVSRYIHINPAVSYLIAEDHLFSYPWSSLLEYMSGKKIFVDTEPILQHFKSINSYRQFLLDHIDYAKKLELIKHLIFEKK